MRHLQITKERIFPIWKALIILKRFRGTLEFESRVNEKFEFNQCDEEWMVSFNAQTSLLEDDIRLRDSVSRHSTSATKSCQRPSSRLSGKIKEVKAEQAVAQLRLQRVKKQIEVKRVAMFYFGNRNFQMCRTTSKQLHSKLEFWKPALIMKLFKLKEKKFSLHHC